MTTCGPRCRNAWTPAAADDLLDQAPMLDADTFRDRMIEWLPARLGGAKDLTVFDVKPPSGNGYSSETALFAARFTLDGQQHERRYVARLKPTREGVFPSYDIDLQHDIMSALADTAVPVP